MRSTVAGRPGSNCSLNAPWNSSSSSSSGEAVARQQQTNGGAGLFLADVGPSVEQVEAAAAAYAPKFAGNSPLAQCWRLRTAELEAKLGSWRAKAAVDAATVEDSGFFDALAFLPLDYCALLWESGGGAERRRETRARANNP